MSRKRFSDRVLVTFNINTKKITLIFKVKIEKSLDKTSVQSYTIVLIKVATNRKVFHRKTSQQKKDRASRTEPPGLNTCSFCVR